MESCIKKCPLLMLGKVSHTCMGRECAWWSESCNCCAMANITSVAAVLNEKL